MPIANPLFHHADPVTLQALVRAHPLATLVLAQGGTLCVNHVPLWWPEASASASAPAPDAGDATAAGEDEADGSVLWGHVGRGNALWHALPQPVVAVFHGTDAYVSPSDYPSKADHGRVVPTWNYRAVHAHGTLHAVHDRAVLRQLLARLTHTHEAARPVPWTLDDAPPGYIDTLLSGIVGVRLQVARWEGVDKLSQNRSPADRAGVVQGLQQRGDPHGRAVAAAMQAREA